MHILRSLCPLMPLFHQTNGFGFLIAQPSTTSSWNPVQEPDAILAQRHQPQLQHQRISSYTSPSFILGNGNPAMLLLLAGDLSSTVDFSTRDFVKDKVARVVDSNTIKLEKGGQVTLAAVKTPTPGSGSNFQYPDCFTKSPAYKIRQLLPRGTAVLSKVVGSKEKSQAVLIRQEDNIIVNQELVRSGFARVKGGNNNPAERYLPLVDLEALQQKAKDEGLGIFKRCDAINNEDAFMAVAPIAQFEPLDLTVETKWGSDGGKQVLRGRDDADASFVPKNPGDRKGCSDFESYEESLQWFEYYRPFYGDVAKLDRNGDGIPCPGLPHTSNRERYRMKMPSQLDASTKAQIKLRQESTNNGSKL